MDTLVIQSEVIPPSPLWLMIMDTASWVWRIRYDLSILLTAPDVRHSSQFEPYFLFPDRPTLMLILLAWKGISLCVTVCTLYLRCGPALSPKQHGEPCLSGAKGTRSPTCDAVPWRSIKILKCSYSRPHRRSNSCWAPLQHSAIC